MDANLKRKGEFLNECNRLLEDYRKVIFSFSSDALEYSSKFYGDLKHLATDYYKGEKLPFDYNYFVSRLITIEKLLFKDYIIDIPSHDFGVNLGKPQGLSNHEKVLDYIVDRTRNYLFDSVALDRSFMPYEAYDLMGKCKDAVDESARIARSLGLFCNKILIHPCFNYEQGERVGQNHACLLIFIDGEEYLVDCTYSQFFVKYRCNLDRIGVPVLSINLGAFAFYDEVRTRVAKQLLEKGWFKFTPEVLKAYFDGFTLSNRNGLYYERTNDFSFTTDYDYLDYKRFLDSNDDLFNHERREELSYQYRPLNNPDMLVRYKKV